MPNLNALATVFAALVVGTLVSACEAPAPPDPLYQPVTLPPRTDAPPAAEGAKAKTPSAGAAENAGEAAAAPGDTNTATPTATATATTPVLPGAATTPVLPGPKVDTKPAPVTPAETGTTPTDAVTAAFKLALLRNPDEAGLAYWLLQLQAGQERIEMLRNVVRSTEFSTARATLTDEQFVTSLYNGFLERPSDAAGHAYWVGELAKGAVSRADAALTFIATSEFRLHRSHVVFF